MSGIRFSGIGSGIDVESIVSQLISLEAIPINRLQRQQAQLQGQQQIFSQFRSRLVSLSTAASALNVASNFNPIKAASSKPEVATVTATSGASAGNYNLEVSKLAQAHKISSAGQANTTDPLSMTGTIVVNGKGISVAATDSLTSLAAKINESGAGVTASLINGGTGSAYITLTSSKSGAKNAIQIADGTGTVASSLGLISGAATARELVNPTTVRSIGFASNTTSVGSQTGLSGTRKLGINGATIELDLGTDSLQVMADKINASAAGVTASVVPVTVSGTTTYKLQISGAGIPAGLSDMEGALEAMGVLQRGFGTQLVAAQDAAYKLDGFNLTSETNTIQDVIPGVTLTLLKANETTPETTTISLSKDNSKIKDQIKSFQSAYNDVIGFIRDNSEFDSETYQSGPLFGDATAAQVEASLSDMLFTNVGSGSLTNLTQLGFGLDEDGKLTLDEAMLDTALTSSPDAVKNLLMATGSTSSASLKYVSSSSKTAPSAGAGYAVNITQIATKTVGLAGTAQTLANAGGEILSFSGSAFGGQTIQLAADLGSTLSDLVNKINSDSRLKSEVVASIEGGVLKLESVRYGTPGRFTVTSNQAAANNNSGVGTTGVTVTDGVDVAGTINGEAATGSGQFLLGNTGNTTTEGLQIQYTGNTLGSIGSVNYTRGIGSLMGFRLESFTDSVNGLITTTDKGLSDQISDLSSRIQNLSEILELRENTLRQKFAAMESAISSLQQQSQRLSAINSGR